jgi:hypothetical protein
VRAILQSQMELGRHADVLIDGDSTHVYECVQGILELSPDGRTRWICNSASLGV